ncbi:MAG: NAD(P)-dependent oxidoreductase [Acidobacteriota bacterium]|nr:NAD(P)-dependent oxidoreductase [Acidobacteriota bacterium]
MPHPLPQVELAEAVDLVGDWSGLRGARLFITGGTGFFGTWLLEVLGAAERTFHLGVEAVVLSRDPARFLRATPHLQNAPWLGFHTGDIATFQPPEGAFSHVIHGAGSSDARDWAREPLALRQTLSAGAQHLMEMLAGQTALRVLYLSSGAVYGPQPAEVTHVPEDFPLPPDTDDPAQAYAQGKREAERILAGACAAAGFPSPIARCFAFAGPHLPLDQHFAFGNFIRDALAGGPVHISGDGTPQRSYLYASELAAWLWALLLRGESLTYHVGSDQALSILELASAIARAAGVPVTLARPPEPGAPPSRYVPAVARIPERLGLRPTVGLDETIARTLRWHRG